MKTKVLIGVVIALVLAVEFVVFLILWPEKSSTSDRVNPTQLLSATHAYIQNIKTQGKPVPAEVSLQELIAQGHLRQEDVSAFKGLEVTLYLHTNQVSPQEILVRARFPDGKEILALEDGSVQQKEP